MLTALWALDWEAAITTRDAGEFPSSASEKRMLRLAASLAGQSTADLGDAITGIDEHNVGPAPARRREGGREGGREGARSPASS